MIPKNTDLAWLVYADWLEERGKVLEAQDLRDQIRQDTVNSWAWEYRSSISIGIGSGVSDSVGGGVGCVGCVGGVGSVGSDSVGSDSVGSDSVGGIGVGGST